MALMCDTPRRMSSSIVQVDANHPIATITLNDPAKRNALSLAMFDALDAAVARIAADPSIHIVLLRGKGPVFCAGFDLAAAVNDPALMATFIDRLSHLNRSLRRMPQVVVAAVHGAAIAGGCAILSGCDHMIVAADATLGYPVHRLGVSPAVTIPTLMQAIGPGAARTLLMSGELINGTEAHRLGLASHLVPDPTNLLMAGNEHCRELATKGPNALRITKAWLNELDGSLQDSAFDRSARGSAELAGLDEARELLRNWSAAK